MKSNIKTKSSNVSKFILKKDLTKYIISKLEDKYLDSPYTFELEKEIINFIRHIERNNLHLIKEGDLEVSFNDNGFLKIHSKSGYGPEELI